MVDAMIPKMIDSITIENAHSVADYLNNIAGYMAEARWHAAEGFGSLLMRKTESDTAKLKLRECEELFFSTHDTCWQIWGN